MRPSRRTLAGCFAPASAILVIWVALFLYLSQQRTELMNEGQTTAANLSRAFEESLGRTIREIDQTMMYVRALRAHEGTNIDLKPWIDAADPQSPLATQISMADKNGIVTLSNLRPPAARIDLSDRAHFRHFAEHPDDHLYISVPVLGRVSRTKTIQFVRMLTTPSGAFDGIIVESVSPDYLVRLYSSVDIGAHGRIALIGLDGIVRARAGGSPATGDQADGPALEAARHADSGRFEWTDPNDKVARVGSFRRVAGYPLIVVVEMSKRELAAGLDEAVPGYLAVAMILTLSIASFASTAIRQRRRAEIAQELTKLALEHVGVGVMVVNPLGRIGMFNARARDMLRLPAAIAPGAHYSQLIQWERENGELTDDHMDSAILAAKQGPRPWRDMPPVFRRHLSDGRVIETRTEELGDGTTVRSFTDITQAEETQRTLIEARDKAEAGVRARAQFLAVISHEIRTPLNGILGVIELLRRTTVTEEQQGYVNAINQSGTHLLGLLTDVLDYSTIERNGVELQPGPFDAGAILRDVADMVRASAIARGLGFAADSSEGLPAQAMGDPVRVRQVLLNLVSNALKFTQSGRVDISLSGRPAADGRWELRYAVADTGIGIEPDMIGTLFEAFTQTERSISRRFGGTGLGLAICHRIAQAMGGRIEVESVPRKGSTFTFVFLVYPVPATVAGSPVVVEEPPDAVAHIASRSPIVLLAEDNEVNRLIAERMLKRIGCRVVIAKNGLEALHLVQQDPIDIVLMDVMMPEMDGLEATRGIRALGPPYHTLPIIGLSANAFRSDAEAGRSAGMNSFVTKPIDTARLVVEIAAALGTGPVTPPQTTPVAGHLQRLRETLGEETAMAVLIAFREDAPRMLHGLRAQAEAISASGVAREAHALAGTTGALGLGDISETVREMERGARRSAMMPDVSALDALEARIAAEIRTMNSELVA